MLFKNSLRDTLDLTLAIWPLPNVQDLKDVEDVQDLKDVEDAASLPKNVEQQQAVLLQDEGKLHVFDIEARREFPVRRSLPSNKMDWQALKIPRWEKL